VPAHIKDDSIRMRYAKSKSAEGKKPADEPATKAAKKTDGAADGAADGALQRCR